MQLVSNSTSIEIAVNAGTQVAAFLSMPNPALDQFSNALFWQVVPVIILCGIGGIILRELLQ